MIPLEVTPPPVDPYPYLPSEVGVDPGGLLGFAAVILGGGFLLYLGLTALVIWATYWLIRLAVRHGGMDVARWQRAGMPHRMPKKRAVREPRPWER